MRGERSPRVPSADLVRRVPHDPGERMSDEQIEEDGGGGDPALPTVRLTRRADEVLVAPAVSKQAGRKELDRFDPFPLPKLRKMLTDHLALLAELVWQRHRRCFGIVLLLDPRTRDWFYGVPRQRCGKAASCWSTLMRDVPEALPGQLLAGSYQTRCFAEGEEAADAPPPVPGVHLVHAVEPEHVIHCFLRADDTTQSVPARMVIVDDLEAALQGWMPRLGFSP